MRCIQVPYRHPYKQSAARGWAWIMCPSANRSQRENEHNQIHLSNLSVRIVQRKKDLTVAEGHVLLVEYVEEKPVLLSRPGTHTHSGGMHVNLGRRCHKPYCLIFLFDLRQPPNARVAF